MKLYIALDRDENTLIGVYSTRELAFEDIMEYIQCTYYEDAFYRMWLDVDKKRAKFDEDDFTQEGYLDEFVKEYMKQEESTFQIIEVGLNNMEECELLQNKIPKFINHHIQDERQKTHEFADNFLENLSKNA